ncbi:thermonuclease family protein [Mesorhizobium onobrychidis]|uniref:Thermonuclease family protein n=1 Tax=Mesorhizobium onobrychidis TaxID=2775404 RepID=A0ABY5R765_9HYPH|nr:thermonuclease family protein [Mesorhizobium onobrychidis]UVC19321.1 thermonuclease family protein [Mesorhizobium onobrychidis]
MKRHIFAAAVSTVIADPSIAADIIDEPPLPPRLEPQAAAPAPAFPVFRGRVAVMDGRTLWYPQYAQRVRLADIDACELPQWALNPKWGNRAKTKAPLPVPCGPLAKAWLKRTVSDKRIECTVLGYNRDGVPLARCAASGRDLALEMLRVGWARVASPNPVNGQYLTYQNYAMAARYGMWATYVLDMNEWRLKAVDKTLDRRPIADFNLLAERESEISPPFADARKKPKRTDR